MSLSISAKIFSKSKRFCLQFQPYQIFVRHFTQKEPKNAKKDRFHVKSLVTLVHNFCFWKKFLEKFVKWQGDQIPGVPSSFDGNWSKMCKFHGRRKNSWKFVYIPAKQCRSHFNLTNYFDKKFQNSNFAQIWDFH